MPDETPAPPAEGLPEPGLPTAKVDYLYRVFCGRADMPPLEKLLARLTSGNPFNPPGSFIFPPGKGMRRLQDALGASKDYFVMGYLREEAPELFEGLARAIAEGGARGFDAHDDAIVADAKLCVVLRAEIVNPPNNEFVETLVHLADAFRDLLDGIVWDVHMGKVFGHAEWRERVMEEPFSVLNHVAVANEGGAVRTRGLAKFGSPDLEVLAVPADVADEVGNMLRDFAEHIIQGELVEADEVIDYTHGRVRLVRGGAGALRIADEDDDAPGGARGMPKVFEALRAARRAAEGPRAEGGRGAG
jgi:hypothetical protein